MINANLYPVHAFTVRRHTGVGRTPDGWETYDLRTVGHVAIVGKSSGWLPCHLAIARRNCHGGPAAYVPAGSTVRVVA